MSNKMPYMDGSCPQCDSQIKIRDSKGMWTTLKANHTQADLYFERDGKTLRTRTLLCKGCVKNPDMQKIFNALVAKGSQATTLPKYIAMLKAFGPPVKAVEVRG